MAILKKLLYAVGYVSLTLWVTLLLAVFLPTTGLLATNLSESFSRSVLDLFRVSGLVASTVCFMIGLEMLNIFPLVQQKLETISTSLLNGDDSTIPVNRKEIHSFISETPMAPSQIATPENVEQINVHSWKQELRKVRGQYRVVFRDIKTGHFIKNPTQNSS